MGEEKKVLEKFELNFNAHQVTWTGFAVIFHSLFVSLSVFISGSEEM